MRRSAPFLLHAAFLVLALFLRLFTVSPLTEREILLQFKGNISDDPYNSLSSWDPSSDPCRHYGGVYCNSAGFVEKILLWNTSLAGVLSSSLSGLRSLRVLSLFGNRLRGNIPLEFGELSSLWKINLSTNALSGKVPEFLGDLERIRFLDLSRNGFSGEIPPGLFRNCYHAKFIALSHNSLSGLIPDSIGICSNLEGFDLSFNNLSGRLPNQVCNSLNLVYLSVRSNGLRGSVGEQISQCSRLELLDLGSNFFSGLAPFGVLELENISYFNVSNNVFQGTVPEISSCSPMLEFFDVSSNNLDGPIPVTIANCINLKVLDFGFNRLNGSIPFEIGELTRLVVVRLGNNYISGMIPSVFGSIELLWILDLHNLNLVSKIPDDISNCRFLRELDFSGNALVGEIPQTLYNLTYLEILNLHRNHLNGSIPSSLGSLLQLHTLDLSDNMLSGSIPESLGNLTKLSDFNLSHNNLSGMIPLSPTIQKFGAAAFLSNTGLCGSPLDIPCSPSSSGKSKILSISTIIAIVAGAVIFTGICMVTLMNVKVHGRKNDGTVILESTPLGSTESNVIIGKLVLFSKSLPSKYKDWEAGTKALLDKDCLIGSGSFGTVFRANFEGGVSIAVKKLESLGRFSNQDDFELDIGRLGNLRHPNLVPYQGYYWSSSMQLILSEFLPNGNLYDNLHGLKYPGTSTSTSTGNPELYWSRRYQIAFGTARALAYLHNDCRPVVLHLNIKSTNILLDKHYNPKLSDYGLAKLLPLLDDHVVTKSHSAAGYVAPELARGRLSEKCDVYSFGVILLELVTGRKPVESLVGNGVVILCEYVRGLTESGVASDCFDRRMRSFAEEELIQVMKLGLICTSELPSRRPTMAEVVQVLETIRNGPGS